MFYNDKVLAVRQGPAGALQTHAGRASQGFPWDSSRKVQPEATAGDAGPF